MAVVYGGASRYLKTQKEISLFAITVYVILFAVGFTFALFKAQLGNHFFTSIIVLLITFGPVYWYVRKLILAEVKTGRSYVKGQKGEGAVYYELLKLPGGYSVFQGVKYARPKNYDIDFVVVGPTGIFAIEVKNYFGDIGFDGKELTRNGEGIVIGGKRRYPIRQVENQYWELHKYLKMQTGKDVFITPVVVIANSDAKMKFGMKPVKGNIFVVQKKWLNDLILSQKTFNYPVAKSVIEEKISLLLPKN